MKRLFALVGVVALAAACTDSTVGPEGQGLEPSAAFGGMGDIASNTDYKLNIIGVRHDKTADMDDNNGRRIFVQLNGGAPVCVTQDDWDLYLSLLDDSSGTPAETPYACTEEEWADFNHLLGGRGKKTGGWDGLASRVNKILLTPNESGVFQVLDANATDNDGAEFTMPDDVRTEYSVYARALGKPGGSAAMTLCANETETTVDGTYPDDVETWCSINQALLTRTKGQPRAEDVTDILFTLTILVDPEEVKDVALGACLIETRVIDAPDYDLTTDDTQIADVPIFHQCFEDYFWNYDNNGLKLLQLWFMQKPSV
jgi:hypothetical protein